MPHLETANSVVRLLRTETVLATEIREGDILIEQGRVVQVTKIERTEYKDDAFFLNFETENAGEGYLKNIILISYGEATIVAREGLAA